LSGIANTNGNPARGTLRPSEDVEQAERQLKANERLVPVGEYAARVRFHRLGQDDTRVMFNLPDAYRELAILELTLDFISTEVSERRQDPAAGTITPAGGCLGRTS